ncbi:MarR family winged helix-turn-helix transcriptional regulator [Actinomadura sp. 9N407]|uniref:MarR family winged helix-turn-helix transcriptional regulator n=1 Tax=Actinomadura sp. 9N407 TaxID=3375154 RepID=UPI0037A948E3
MTGRQGQGQGDDGVEASAEVTAAIERALSTAALAWNRADQGLEEHVSPVQLRAVEALARHGEVNLRGLAAELDVIPSSASRLCDRLEAAGLLVREHARADRREIVLRLSARGEELFASLARRRRAVVAEALAGMSPGSRARLLDSLQEFGRATGLGEIGEPGERRRRA